MQGRGSQGLQHDGGNLAAFERAIHRVWIVPWAVGSKRDPVPWARSEGDFTLLFEVLIMVLMRDMPWAVIARLLRKHDTLLWRAFTREGDHRARAKEDFSEVC